MDDAARPDCCKKPGLTLNIHSAPARQPQAATVRICQQTHSQNEAWHGAHTKDRPHKQLSACGLTAHGRDELRSKARHSVHSPGIYHSTSKHAHMNANCTPVAARDKRRSMHVPATAHATCQARTAPLEHINTLAGNGERSPVTKQFPHRAVPQPAMANREFHSAHAAIGMAEADTHMACGASSAG
jgi:hypothetical protein